MAILISRDGKFFEVPDDELENLEVPPEKVKELLAEMGPEAAGGGEAGGVEPYGRRRRRRWWHNYWSNCWNNCWRNCY